GLVRAARRLALAALAAIAGCGGPAAPPPAVPAAWIDSLPASMRGVLMIEGMPDSATFLPARRLASTKIFYRPDDLVPGRVDAPGRRVDLFFPKYPGNPH